jgi:hypothetical protein
MGSELGSEDGSWRGIANEAAAEPGEGGRVRRSTLERFNDELAVLDRPLEDDVEYYDDPPPRQLLRRAAAACGVLALVGAGAVLAVGRRSASANSNDGERPRVAVVLRRAPSPAPPAALPGATRPPVAERAAPATDVDGPAAEADSAVAPAAETSQPPSLQDWAKLRPAEPARKQAPAMGRERRKHHHARRPRG